MKIAFISSDPFYLNNRIFGETEPLQGAHSANAHWLEPYRAWKRKAEASGMLIGTQDRIPIDHADVAVYLDTYLPRSQVLGDRRRFPKLRQLRLAFESPLFQPWIFDRRNIEQFDQVVSFAPAASVRAPVPTCTVPLDQWVPFSERKMLTLLNANQSFGIKSRLSHLKKTYSLGWKFGPGAWIDYFNLRELYSERESLVQQAERTLEGSFDLWGRGWESKFRSCRGIAIESKLNVLSRYRFAIAYENCSGSVGYVTEKLWDCFLARTVPVYLGDREIRSQLPEGVAFFRDDFDSDQDLLNALSGVTESQWTALIQKGSDFLKSTAFHRLGSEPFADQMVSICEKAV